ncbi:Hypothetical protein D9617_2g057200 [Elsinoe fawcettii]|nr:Hypothetical protein D9617_2g057200 [Elsinoe fawcettii]
MVENQEDLIPLLLLPSLLPISPSTLPLLSTLQSLLNRSFNHFPTVRPDLFPPNFRAASPETVAQTPGKEGFFILLLSPDVNGDVRVVAMGAVKDFPYRGAEDHVVEVKRFWAQRIAGEGKGKVLEDVGTVEVKGEEVPALPSVVEDEGVRGIRGMNGVSGPQEERKRDEGKGRVKKFEVTAFGVEPDIQSRGLGKRVLREIRWVNERGLFGERIERKIERGHGLVRTWRLRGAEGGEVKGIDLRNLRRTEEERSRSTQNGQSPGEDDFEPPELVLMCVRDVGSENYYLKQGFKTVADGTVPVGMWHCKKECTWVYMEDEEATRR